MNVNILRISELKWTGMGEFNSDDHYSYYWGQESHRSEETPETPPSSRAEGLLFLHGHTLR